MTSVTSLASQLPVVRPAVSGSVDTRLAGVQASAPPPTDRPSLAIDAQLDAQVSGGSLTSDQATSLKDFFDEGPGNGSTGSLMRTASEQLDQFDRVLSKLRASMGGGATYGMSGVAPQGGSGLVVDRLA